MNYVERGLGQHKKARSSLFTFKFGNAPLAIVCKVTPSHRDYLLAALRRQQCNSNEGSESSVSFCCTPYLANLVIIKNAGTSPRLCIRSAHPLHDRACVILVSGCEPICNHAKDGKCEVGRNR